MGAGLYTFHVPQLGVSSPTFFNMPAAFLVRLFMYVSKVKNSQRCSDWTVYP